MFMAAMALGCLEVRTPMSSDPGAERRPTVQIPERIGR